MYILFLKRVTGLLFDQILLLSISNPPFRNSAWCVQAVVDHSAGGCISSPPFLFSSPLLDIPLFFRNMQPSSSWHTSQENTRFGSLLDYCQFLQTRQVPQLKATRMYYIILYYFNLHNFGSSFFLMKQARRENIHIPESNFFVSSQKHFFELKYFS